MSIKNIPVSLCVACLLRGIEKPITWRFYLCKACEKKFGKDRDIWPQWLREAVNEEERRRKALERSQIILIPFENWTFRFQSGAGQHTRLPKRIAVTKSGATYEIEPEVQPDTEGTVFGWRANGKDIYMERDRWMDRITKLGKLWQESEKQCAVVAFTWIGLTQGEIGEILGISQAAVSKLLSHAKRNLKSFEDKP